ncbi:hypothetical protein BX616_010964 [Lobosporangium transversale]|nr:hypothetical protein BX616_010964 [Lobosporangium transversale]
MTTESKSKAHSDTNVHKCQEGDQQCTNLQPTGQRKTHDEDYRAQTGQPKGAENSQGANEERTIEQATGDEEVVNTNNQYLIVNNSHIGLTTESSTSTSEPDMNNTGIETSTSVEGMPTTVSTKKTTLKKVPRKHTNKRSIHSVLGNSNSKGNGVENEVEGGQRVSTSILFKRPR